MTLEDKLIKILDDFTTKDSDKYLDEHLAVPEIIQAFKDDGWVRPYYKSVSREELKSDHNYKQCMSGHEWYKKFEKEILNVPLANTVDVDNHSWRCEDVTNAAKRASNIEDKE